jgi:hypothetical protein
MAGNAMRDTPLHREDDTPVLGREEHRESRGTVRKH